MTELFPYQKTGAEWLATRKRAFLADEMGLGKSAQAITAADLAQCSRILVLCPAVARENWKREFERFSTAGRKFTVIESKAKTWERSHSLICSYDLAAIIPTKDAHPFDLLILDEAHYLKSIAANRTKAVLGKDGLIRRAAKTWCLSGTPAPNNASELWPILYTFGVTSLQYDDFVDRYCNGYVGPRGFQITGTKASTTPELRNMMAPILLRRRKDEVMKELPPIFFQDLAVEASDVDLNEHSSFTQYIFPQNRQAELWERLTNERKVLSTTLDATGVARRDGMKALEALAESVSTLRRYTGLQKMPAIAELIKSELEANAYEKIVIFAIHRDVIEGLRTRLAKFGAVTLYGGTDPAKKVKNIDKFQMDPKCRVFIGNIQACGTAITLTAAHNVLFAEQDWVPGNNAQASMRCHRIGQTKPVTVRFAGLANSIDEKISQVLKRKTRQIDAIFTGPKLHNCKVDDNSSFISKHEVSVKSVDAELETTPGEVTE